MSSAPEQPKHSRSAALGLRRDTPATPESPPTDPYEARMTGLAALLPQPPPAPCAAPQPRAPIGQIDYSAYSAGTRVKVVGNPGLTAFERGMWLEASPHRGSVRIMRTGWAKVVGLDRDAEWIEVADAWNLCIPAIAAGDYLYVSDGPPEARAPAHCAECERAREAAHRFEDRLGDAATQCMLLENDKGDLLKDNSRLRRYVESLERQLAKVRR